MCWWKIRHPLMICCRTPSNFPLFSNFSSLIILRCSHLFNLIKTNIIFNFDIYSSTNDASGKTFDVWWCTPAGPSEFFAIFSIFFNLFYSQFFYLWIIIISFNFTDSLSLRGAMVKNSAFIVALSSDPAEISPVFQLCQHLINRWVQLISHPLMTLYQSWYLFH